MIKKIFLFKMQKAFDTEHVDMFMKHTSYCTVQWIINFYQKAKK